MGTKSLSSEDVFSVLINEQLGFSFGKPLRVDESSLAVVLPILRETSLKRQYTTFPESEKVLVFDTGRIDEMEVQNTTDDTVFIRSGTIFKGSTQSRALQRSAVVFHGQRSKLSVRCIHQTHGIRGGANVKYGGLTPLNMDSSVYEDGFKPKDQASYWSSVAANTTNMSKLSGKPSPSQAPHREMRGRMSGIERSWGSSHHGDAIIGSSASFLNESVNYMQSVHSGPAMDDLASNIDSFAKDFDSILSKVRMVDNQAGLSLITHRGVETIEIFDHTESWKALHDSAVKRLGQNFVDKDKENVFDYKPEVAVKKTMEVLALPWERNRIYEHKPSNGEPHVLISGLTAKDYVGELVEVNEHVIHLVVLKKAA